MIGSTIKIKGDVTGDEDLVIEGSVEGTIDLAAHEVTVGESGKVKANIKGKTVIVNGHVVGDITGGEKVVISKTGDMRGNIVTPRMSLEDGAVFKGSIDMDPSDTSSRKGPGDMSQPKSAIKASNDDSGLNVKNG